jgi:hypothetical protein
MYVIELHIEVLNVETSSVAMILNLLDASRESLEHETVVKSFRCFHLLPCSCRDFLGEWGTGIQTGHVIRSFVNGVLRAKTKHFATSCSGSRVKVVT